MHFFKQYFKDTVFDSNEVAVRCPFTHKDQNGKAYLETRPSAHVNVEKQLFHCKVCGEGYSETKFLSKVNGISYREAKQLLAKLNNNSSDDFEKQHMRLVSNNTTVKEVEKLGINLETIKELKLGYEGLGVSFPVFMYGELLDVRKYNYKKLPDTPKIQSRSGAQANLILPFDIWLHDERDTLIMAGEKDMAIARSLGYNAISFTGGEMAFPRLFKHSFKGKKCYIVYDNDNAGIEGSKKVAALLKEVGATPYVVTGHHEVATEKGEDFWDYIMKYNKTKSDFDAILDNTSQFTEDEYQKEKEKIIPSVSIIESTKGQYRNKLVRSSIQVTATFEQSFGIADYVEVEKKKDPDNGESMKQGEIKEWSLDENNVEDILLLMDSRLKEKEVDANYIKLCGVNPKEKNIKLRKLSYDTVFKAVVTDLMESDIVINDPEEEGYKQPLEMQVYTIGKKLQSGMKYKLTYKIVPHPLNSQENVMLVTDIEESDDTVSKFKLTESVKDSLKVFQGDPFTKMDEIFNRAKGLIGSFANEHITLATDLFYHTPLKFKFGRHSIRGYLDVFICGESRTGKSATAETLLKTYQLGTFTSLKNSTIAGVIGGSNKVNGTFKTTVGTLPKNHKGAIIFEEFSGADPKFIKALTDIRSSNQVRLTRVNGELNLPAYVRMLTISNQKPQSDNYTKPLKNYPNGVSVLIELIGASEDLARYDFFVLAGEPAEYDDPLAIVDDPFEIESYRNRIRWVWSRTENQIVFEDGVDRYIVDEAKKLNEEFNSHVKFFGSEAWKKLSRVAVATASSVVSTDETFENIIVKKEHVDWAVNFLKGLYDNDLFKLKQYVQEQRKYSHVDDECINAVQDLYQSHAVLLTQMESTSSMSQRNLQAISGQDNQGFNEVINRMVQLLLIQYQGDKIVPTERFRVSMSKINRNSRVLRVGEVR